jgi:hypothetical protein
MGYLMLRRLTSILTILAILLSGAFNAKAAQISDTSESSEYLIKAGFIYHFAKFVDWPANAMGHPDSPIVIGILGTDPFGDVIDSVVAGKKIEGHAFVIRRLKWNNDLKSLRNCDILFVSASMKDHVAEVMNAVKSSPVLTIGETPGFARQGGIIRFVLEDNRVRFEINVDAAHQAGLTISSRLLSLAKIVGAAPEAGKQSQ